MLARKYLKDFLHWSYMLMLLAVSQILAKTDDVQGDEPHISEIVTSFYPDNHPCHPFSDYDREKMEFFSPGYPAETYPNNTECVCILEAPPGETIKLDFRDFFEIEDSVGCKNDFLEIRDGSHGYNDILNKPFCGNEFPPVISSTDRHLWIYFKSDETIECRGFKAVFEFIKRPPDVPEIIPCNIKRALEDEGVIGKQDIPKALMETFIQNDMPIDCVWNITVKPGWNIQLQFQQFALERTNDCDSNFIDVFSGDTNMKSRLKNFCGSIADTVPSKHNTMFVRYYSESKGNKSYFEANFTAFRSYKKGQGKCTKEEFDCEDNTCISAKLKCNKLYNCRFRWDEDGCNTGKSLGFSEEHIVIIMVIFSLILAGMCFTFMFNCVRKLLRDHHAIQEYIRQSREQQLNELDKSETIDRNHDSKNRSLHSSPSVGSHRIEASRTTPAPCYVPGGDLLPILVRNENSIPHGNCNQNIYTVDYDSPVNMCDSACQTRESLLTNQEGSFENTPSHNSVRTDSPLEPFSTFGYNKKDKFKAEAKIQLGWKLDQDEGKRPYSVQTTKSAPDVIVTH